MVSCPATRPASLAPAHPSLLPLLLPLLVALPVALDGRAHAQSVERLSVASDGTPGNAPSDEVSLSDDGALAAFASDATNLVAGDTNGATDIFLRDRVAGTTRRVSVSSSGVQANGASHSPRLSGDGRFVAFTSAASNLVTGDTANRIDVFLHEIATGVTTRLSRSTANLQANGDCFEPAISFDGRYVAFASNANNLAANDTNSTRDIFLRDTQLNTTRRVSVTASGGEGNNESEHAALTRDGKYVAFQTGSFNLDPADLDGVRDIYRKDISGGALTLVSLDAAGKKGNWDSIRPTLSDDGRFIAFESQSDVWLPGDSFGTPELFVKDLQTGSLTCWSVDSDGTLPPRGNALSHRPTLSSDGLTLAFASSSHALVEGDSNGADDVFCRNAMLQLTTRQSVDAAFDEADLGSSGAIVALTGDARFVAYASDATDLLAGGAATRHVYLRERPRAAAAWSSYGSGWPGRQGVPSLSVSAPPQLNQPIDLLIGNSSGLWSVALVVLGASSGQWPTGFEGDLLVAPDATLLLALPPSGLAFGDRVPPDEAWIGARLFVQALQLDPAASDGVSFTPGVELDFGE
ncbi:MAG: PD40 domain-containing protein [Planctomycetes bacterium]|nr:PD40 domain-containing protein [Planctomycetota bacterium]